MKLKLIEKKEQAGDAVSFIFESKNQIDWRPGQFMHYTLDHEADDRGVERWFTISNAPYEKNVAITTRILPREASTFKTALNKIPVGKEVEADGPKGKFILDTNHDFTVFLAGGIGITPYRSMFLQAGHDKLSFSGVLLYANRNNDIVFQDELEAAATGIGVEIEYYIGSHSLEIENILDAIPNLAKPFFYISGPEPMVEHYEKALLDMGFADDQIKRDFFPGYAWPLT